MGAVAVKGSRATRLVDDVGQSERRARRDLAVGEAKSQRGRVGVVGEGMQTHPGAHRLEHVDKDHPGIVAISRPDVNKGDDSLEDITLGPRADLAFVMRGRVDRGCRSRLGENGGPAGGGGRGGERG